MYTSKVQQIICGYDAMSRDKSSFKSIFGRNLKLARKQADLNQEELAQLVGVSRDTLSRYERGDIIPSAEVLAALVVSLGPDVSSDSLLFGEKDSGRLSPIILESFGSLVGFDFRRGGLANVSLGYPEVVRILQACIAYEMRRASPNKALLAKTYDLIEYFSDDASDIELLAKVVIAIHAAKLVPEWPDEEQAEQAISSLRDATRAAKTLLDEVDSEAAPENVRQNIKGSGHQIAGRNITNNNPTTKKK